MKLHKMSLVILVLSLFLLIPNGNIVFAMQDSVTDSAEPVPTPDWAYIYQTTTLLSISTSGVAEATGILTGYPGTTTEVWIFLYLERYTNGTWTTVTSWYQGFDSYRGTLIRTTSVTSGYWYRVRASYYAYSGDVYEHVTQYSSSVYY